jgi:hypothetical protein
MAMQDDLLLDIVDLAERGQGLRLPDVLLRKTANRSHAEVFRIGRARSGGEKDGSYVNYRTMDPRGNYKIEYLDMNEKTGLELLNVYLRGAYDWVYLGSFAVTHQGEGDQLVDHQGQNARNVIATVRQALSEFKKSPAGSKPRADERDAFTDRVVSKTRKTRAAR